MTRLLDLIERTGWTAVQAGLAVWIALDLDLFSSDALEVAGTAAAVAAVKCLLAFQIGSGNTAATLPAGPDTDLGGDPVSFSMIGASFVGSFLALIAYRLLLG